VADLDINQQWTTVVEFLDGTNGAGFRAERVYALSPRPTVLRDEEEWSEEQLPLVVVEVTGGTQNRERASANNQHQVFDARFHLYVAHKGSDKNDANVNCLAIVSAIINDLTGSGAFLGTNRSRLFDAIVNSWDWDAATRDSLIAQAFIDITATFYRF
jgi:hypothetical protein